jgi:hypothetical protein
MAHVNINRQGSALWTITLLDVNHNHPPLLLPGTKASRPTMHDQKALVKEFADHPKFEQMHLEKILKHEFPDHPLDPRQISSLITNARHERWAYVESLGGDVNSVLNILDNNPDKYQYKLRLDENQTVTALFWQTTEQMELCRRYSDVLLTDNSYNRNQYQYILNLGLGINNANQSRTLWQAIHAMEDLETQNWVFQCHLECAGRAPEVVASDRHQTLITSVQTVLPTTFHLYCLHHLSDNVASQLRLALGSEWEDFMCQFWVLYRAASPEIFDRIFEDLVQKFPRAERYL